MLHFSPPHSLLSGNMVPLHFAGDGPHWRRPPYEALLLVIRSPLLVIHQIWVSASFHRKHPGGRGNAGGMHHHRILFDNYHPDYFGKVGMRYFHKLRNKFYCPIVNVDKLWSLVPQDVKEKSSADKASVVNVTQFGYFKVLGKGMVPPSQPLVVKAKLISKKEIKEAGGAVVLTA